MMSENTAATIGFTHDWRRSAGDFFRGYTDPILPEAGLRRPTGETFL